MLPARPSRFPLSRVDLLILALLSILLVLVFHRVSFADFVPFDDDIEITSNSHIQGLNPTNLTWMFTDTQLTQRYTPLSWIVWALLFRGFGLNPMAFHLEALVVHLLNTCLVYLLVRAILFRWQNVQPRAPTPAFALQLSLAAGLGTALWALHPLRVEVVAWATQVRFAEATLFMLLAILAYFRATDQTPDQHSLLRSKWFWAAVCASMSSVLFYPVGIGLPLILLLLDVLPLRRIDPQNFNWKSWLRLGLEKIPFLIVPIFVAIMTILGRINVSGFWHKPATLADFSITARIMQAGYIFIYYLWKPFDTMSLSPVYTTLVKCDPWSAPFIASVLAVIGITLAAIFTRRRWPLLAVLWFSHLILIMPMGGYFEHPHYSNDRYAYLQGILGAIIVAIIIIPLWKHLPSASRFLATIVFLMLVLTLSLFSHFQTYFWRNGETLFNHMIVELGDDPYREDIYWRLGKYYLQQHNYPAALAAADQTLKIVPNHPIAWNIIITTLRHSDNYPAIEAALREALKYDSKIEWYLWLNEAILKQGRDAEARQNLETTLLDNPDSPNEIALRLLLAQVLLHQNHPDLATAQLRLVLQKEPENSAAQQLLDSMQRATTTSPAE